MQGTVYNQEGQKTGSVELPAELFDVKWNSDLVHQVVVSMQSNARQPIAHTKGRSEVAGTGRKPWRQKGTGRARHGSRISNIWVGGAVAHGPVKEKNFQKKINKKMKAKALAAVLSRKLADQEVILLDGLDLEAPQTKAAKQILDNLSRIKEYSGLVNKKKNAVCIAYLEQADQSRQSVKQSFRNFGNVELVPVDSLNPVKLLSYKYLILEQPEAALGVLKSRISKDSVGAEA